MKLISWNVNGLRACVTKGFADYFNSADADIFAIQETKLQPGQIDLAFSGYDCYMNSAEKKGYSGTMVFTRLHPIAEFTNFDAWRALCPEIDIPHGFESEGRILTLEFSDFYFIDVYVPNSQRELTRLEYRMQWEDLFRRFLIALNSHKPVIVCGDMNVAHKEIDLKNPKSNRKNAGFTDEERGKMTELLSAGFTDSFRHLYPDRADAYSWWSYMGNAREKNVGWRIDYFITSESLKNKIKDAFISPEIFGSDHCPVGLEIDI
ncbi:MAG: exodeoxyribonuclease III [Clostridia bacterium]|nr:exodeoxyribonuclease III [Clostridia bacterium]